MENVYNQSIWADEGVSAILSMKSFFQMISIIFRDASPPLWNIFEYLTFQIFGPNEIAIRSLSLTFYLIAVFFTYKITRVLFHKRVQTALLVTLLISLNPLFFAYAFEGRTYSLLSAGVAGSMYFFVKTFFDEGSPKTRLGYIIMTLWALYSHYFAIFAILFQGLWWVYELALGKRKTAKKFFKAFLFVVVGYVPWFYPLYTQTKMVSGGFWLGTPTTTDLRNLLYEYLAEGIKNSNFRIPTLNETYYHTSLYLVFSILILRKWWRAKRKTIFLLLWFLGPILLTWYVSQKFQSIFFNRYLLYSIPPAMIILGSARNKLSFIPILLTLFLFGAIDHQYFTHPSKLPFKEYSKMVKKELKPGDYLINWNSSGHHIWETKFYEIGAPIYAPSTTEQIPFVFDSALLEPDDVVHDIPKWAERVGVISSGPVEEIVIPGWTQSEIKNVDKIKFIFLLKKFQI